MNDVAAEGDLIARKEGAAGIIRLNRPKAINAVTLEMFHDIDRALGDIGQLSDRHQLRRGFELRNPAAMLVGAVRGDRNQRQALDAPIECLDDISADRAKTGDRYPQFCLVVSHHFPPASILTRR